MPGEVGTSKVKFDVLKPISAYQVEPNIGFPEVCGGYIHINETTEPIRMETFKAPGDEQVKEGARRAYLYARLLPGYGFPVGLEIADKHAHIPNWMTSAYSKLSNTNSA